MGLWNALEGRLCYRENVISGLVARAQTLVNALSPVRAAELSQRCDGQPAPEIAKILEDFFLDVRRAACELPSELKLPPQALAVYQQLMEALDQ